MPTIDKRRNRDRSASDVAQIRVRPFEPVSVASATKDDAEAWAEKFEGASSRRSCRSTQEWPALWVDNYGERARNPSVLRIAWVLERASDIPLTGAAVERANGAPR